MAGQTENHQDWINSYGPNGGQQQNTTHGLGGTLTMILVLGVIWAAGSIIWGVLYMLGGTYLLFFPFAGAVLVGVGLLYLVGGLLALLSSIYIYRQEKYDEAHLFCLIGSVIALFTGYIIAGIVGIVFAFLLKKEKYRFRS